MFFQRLYDYRLRYFSPMELTVVNRVQTDCFLAILLTICINGLATAAEDIVHAMRPSETNQIAISPAVGSQYAEPFTTSGPNDLFTIEDPTVFPLTEANWSWQILPDGLIWRSYLAGPKEPRIGVNLFWEKNSKDRFWDGTLGGRVSVLRYGTFDPIMPQGVEFQIEGAAFPRLTLDSDRDLVACDYRVGVPLVFRRGPFEGKFSYYHLSSHLGDEFMIRNPRYRRVNYSRDVMVAALGFYPTQNLRVYGEVGWAFASDVCDPWEFQFGVEYSSLEPTGLRGSPFFAINGHLHEEHNFGGALTVEAGWQWRGRTGHLLRTGLHYFNGMSEMYEFYDEHEQQIGWGFWYDF
jgi:Protein of unknown function (DUF1207)